MESKNERVGQSKLDVEQTFQKILKLIKENNSSGFSEIFAGISNSASVFAKDKRKKQILDAILNTQSDKELAEHQLGLLNELFNWDAVSFRFDSEQLQTFRLRIEKIDVKDESLVQKHIQQILGLQLKHDKLQLNNVKRKIEKDNEDINNFKNFLQKTMPSAQKEAERRGNLSYRALFEEDTAKTSTFEKPDPEYMSNLEMLIQSEQDYFLKQPKDKFQRQILDHVLNAGVAIEGSEKTRLCVFAKLIEHGVRFNNEELTKFLQQFAVIKTLSDDDIAHVKVICDAEMVDFVNSQKYEDARSVAKELKQDDQYKKIQALLPIFQKLKVILMYTYGHEQDGILEDFELKMHENMILYIKGSLFRGEFLDSIETLTKSCITKLEGNFEVSKCLKNLLLAITLVGPVIKKLFGEDNEFFYKNSSSDSVKKMKDSLAEVFKAEDRKDNKAGHGTSIPQK